jgi:DNA mismatch repair ATPase MutL
VGIKKDHLEHIYHSEQSVTVFAETGTMITIQQPFINLPVRRQLAQKNAAAIAKRIQDVLVKYALAHPSVRFLLYDAPQSAGKPSVWIKPPTSDIEGSITTIFGSQLSKMLERCIETDPQHTSLTVDILLPKKDSGKSKKKRKKKRLHLFISLLFRSFRHLKRK